jgi:mRNA interferase MazF
MPPGTSPIARGWLIKRGDLFFADLSPTVGSEINKCRPVLIVSNNANNLSAITVTVLPLTYNISRVYPFEVALAAGESGLPKDSKVQAQQIRTIAKERIQGVAVGYLELDRMQAVEAALRLHLGL